MLRMKSSVLVFATVKTLAPLHAGNPASTRSCARWTERTCLPLRVDVDTVPLYGFAVRPPGEESVQLLLFQPTSPRSHNTRPAASGTPVGSCDSQPLARLPSTSAHPLAQVL